jgi:phage/plasmid-associated DNA primase
MPDPELRSRITHGENAPDEWLHWIVDGAVAFFEDGFPDVPEAVEVATREWLNGANKPLTFIDEALVLQPGHVTLSSEVYAEYREWCELEGTRPLSAETFWQRAQAHPWFRNGDAVKPKAPFRVRVDETIDDVRPRGVVRGVRGVRLASKITPAQARAADVETDDHAGEEEGAVRRLISAR